MNLCPFGVRYALWRGQRSRMTSERSRAFVARRSAVTGRGGRDLSPRL